MKVIISLLLFLSMNLHAKELFEAEILLYEGVQYFNFMGRSPSRTLVIGEDAISFFEDTSKPMTMYFLGSDKQHQFFGNSRNQNSILTHINILWKKKEMTDPSLYECSFEVDFHQSLYWLSGEYQCSPNIEVNILNDNTEIN